MNESCRCRRHHWLLYHLRQERLSKGAQTFRHDRPMHCKGRRGINNPLSFMKRSLKTYICRLAYSKEQRSYLRNCHFLKFQRVAEAARSRACRQASAHGYGADPNRLHLTRQYVSNHPGRHSVDARDLLNKSSRVLGRHHHQQAPRRLR